MTPALSQQITSYQHHMQKGEVFQAREVLNILIETFPNEQMYKVFALSGEIYKASLLYHRIHQMTKYWQGESLQGKTILLYCEFGFEYSLLFLRYLPFVYSQQPKEIQLLVAPEHHDFFVKNMPDLYTIVDEKAKGSCDYHCDLFSMPYLFHYDDDSIRPNPPYLFHLSQAKESRKSNKLSIALFVQEEKNSSSLWSASIVLESKNHFAYINALLDYDIIVTDSNTVAHICGAINKRCYFLLPLLTHWEWGFVPQQGKIASLPSRWYESVWLYHDNVFREYIYQAIKQEIKQLTSSDLAPKYKYSQSFSAQVDTVFCAKNMLLFKQATHTYEEGNYKKSFSIAQTLSEQYPMAYEINTLLGKISLKFNNNDKAIEYLELSLKNTPHQANARMQLGKAYGNKKQWQKSIKNYERAIELDPVNIQSYNFLAMLYQYELHDYAKAQQCFSLCLEKCDCSKHEFIYYNIGVLYQKLDIPKAIAYFKQDLAINPRSSKTYNNLGNCYASLRDDKSAIECFQTILQIDPCYDMVYGNLGIAYKNKHNFKQALAIYQKGFEFSYEHKKTISWNLSITHLMLGEYEIGLELYESRVNKDLKFYDQFDKRKLWQGENITGKTVLVYFEQGFGDTIQFIRYLDLVLHLKPQEIVVLAQSQLRSLLQNSFAQVRCVDVAGDIGYYDYHCAVMSLPYIFGSDVYTIPRRLPYLRSFSREKNDQKKQILFDANSVNIGIVWKASDTAFDSEKRDIELEHFMQLKNIKNAKLYSLQVGKFGDEVSQNGYEKDIVCLRSEIDDFASTARLLQNLDCVVCIDTAIAHLCGAMNIPCFVLLHHASSWRWLTDRIDTIWYASLRLYRINESHNVRTSMEQISADISSRYFDKAHTKSINEVFYSFPRNLKEEYQSMLEQSIRILKSPSSSLQKLKQAKFLLGRLLVKFENELLYKYALVAEKTIHAKEESSLYFETCCFYYKKLLAVKSSLPDVVDFAKLHYEQHIKTQDRKYLNSAISMLEQCYSHKQTSLDSLELMVDIYQKLALFDESIFYTKLLIKQNHKLASSYINLAYFYLEGKKQDKLALKYYKKSYKHAPSLSTTVHIANLYKHQGEHKKAIAIAYRALCKEPRHMVLQQIIGTSLKMLNRVEESIYYFQRLIEQDLTPVTGHNLAYLHLLLGNYSEGWRHQEHRLEFDALKEKTAYFDENKRYKGGDLQGKVLAIHFEQGFGDTIQFVRFLPLLEAKKPKQIIVFLQKELMSLCEASFLSVTFVQSSFKEAMKMPYYDYYISLMSIPLALGVTIFDLPTHAPYLKPKSKELPLHIDTNKLNIAIAWESNRLSDTHADRSCLLSDMMSLFSVLNVQFYSLQIGEGANDIKHLRLEHKIIDTANIIQDFNDTALIVQKMDLIISIDTATAHLAGALNKECLILVPFNPNWRWNLYTKTSIWYPSNVTIFRQKQGCGYRELIEEKIVPIVKRRANLELI